MGIKRLYNFIFTENGNAWNDAAKNSDSSKNTITGGNKREFNKNQASVAYTFE